MPGLFEADEACPGFNFHDQFNPERYQALSIKILAAYLVGNHDADVINRHS
jgi:hypothetical protein